MGHFFCPVLWQLVTLGFPRHKQHDLHYTTCMSNVELLQSRGLNTQKIPIGEVNENWAILFSCPPTRPWGPRITLLWH